MEYIRLYGGLNMHLKDKIFIYNPQTTKLVHIEMFRLSQSKNFIGKIFGEFGGHGISLS